VPFVKNFVRYASALSIRPNKGDAVSCFALFSLMLRHFPITYTQFCVLVWIFLGVFACTVFPNMYNCCN